MRAQLQRVVLNPTEQTVALAVILAEHRGELLALAVGEILNGVVSKSGGALRQKELRRKLVIARAG